MWMSLKAKLCILKNYTLLLLGPSPFEHWLKSYLYITERPLCFLLFTTRSPSSSPIPSSLCSLLCCTPPPPPGPERRPAALCPLHLAPRVALSLSPPPVLPALVAPHPSTSGRCLEQPPRCPSGTPAPPAALRLAACFPSSFSLFPATMRCYKTGSSLFSPAVLPSSSLHDTEPPPLIPHRNPPQPHCRDPIPLALCFLTSSPSSPA
jgi:hypothetical protein